jgi:hypothetical protein
MPGFCFWAPPKQHPIPAFEIPGWGNVLAFSIEGGALGQPPMRGYAATVHAQGMLGGFDDEAVMFQP